MEQCKIAIATNALGKAAAGHSIERRLRTAKQAGFDGVEVAIECLEALAADNSPSEHQHRAVNLRKAAIYTRKIADSHSLKIIALNPFAAFDALKDDSAVESRLQEAKLWLELCNLMRCEILQVRPARTSQA
jgi:4-hydroxyphenylpyruvate dioxygenase